MADELSETAGGATKGLLGTVGFILILLGGEILVDKSGERLSLGLWLVAAGIPIFFVGVFWKWIQQRIASGIAQKLNFITADPMWWVAIFSVFTTFSLNQLGLAATLLWLVLLGAVYASYSWRKAGKGETVSSLKHDDVFYSPTVTQGPPPSPNQQSDRDILLLLSFAVDEITISHLDEILERTPQSMKSKTIIAAENLTKAEHDEAREFLTFAERRLSHTNRGGALQAVMQNAEHEADQEIVKLERDGTIIDPLNRRRWAIAHNQAYRAYQYISAEKREVEDRLRSQRSGLIDRLELRKK